MNHPPVAQNWNSRKRKKTPHRRLPCSALRSAQYRTKPLPRLQHHQPKLLQSLTHLTATYPHATHHRPTPSQHQHRMMPSLRPPPQHHHPPHPPPALRTQLSSPPMFPFYRKHVRGTHPSIPLGCALHSGTAPTPQQHPHATLYRSLFHVPTGTANCYLSSFPMTSSITSIPQHIPLDDQSHQVPYHHLTLVQPLPPTPLQFSHRYPHSRCATNRAAGGHAPTNHPADSAPSRRCSCGRAQLTPQQLIVSPGTLTQRVTTKKNATTV